MENERARTNELEVCIAYLDSEIVVAIRGDVDNVTAADLGALIVAATAYRPEQIVIDLSDAGFFGADGLNVLAKCASGLAPSARLMIRGSTPFVRKLVEFSSIPATIEFEAAPTKLGAEQQAGDDSRGVVGDEIADLSLAAAVPASDAVVDAALRLVVAVAQRTVAGADGVSVTLNRHGHLRTVASTNETVRQMDRDQYATGEGPCLDAATKGRWFHIEAMADETRWPEFTPLALGDGIRSILSTPLLTRDTPVGALNIYSENERSFGEQEQDLAALFATQASSILTDAGFGTSADDFNERLHDGLTARNVIAQAQGILMARSRITPLDADRVLYREARSMRIDVRQYAQKIVDSVAILPKHEHRD